ncbi:MAG: rhodanese-like domain-containing protein [Thiogranum sp.]|nr:rhodanese-like domain-containing protein [Thiogranum sp.]
MTSFIPSALIPDKAFCRLRDGLLLMCCLLLAALNCNAAEKPYAPESVPGAVTVTAEQVVELILSKPDLVIIDSRKKSEYMKGHIEGAVNLLNTALRQEDLEEACPDKSTPIVFYCNGVRCLRSSDALGKAIDWGYRNLFWFRGGWKEWKDKRLPVISN